MIKKVLLTTTGDLFCGDLLLNIAKPSPTDMLDDTVDLEDSLKKLQNFSFRTLYPGHGKPFMMEQFLDLIYNRNKIQTNR